MEKKRLGWLRSCSGISVEAEKLHLDLDSINKRIDGLYEFDRCTYMTSEINFLRISCKRAIQDFNALVQEVIILEEGPADPF